MFALWYINRILCGNLFLESAIGTIPSTVTTIQWRPNSSGAVTMRYYVTVRGGKVKLEIYTVPQVKSKIICS